MAASLSQAYHSLVALLPASASVSYPPRLSTNSEEDEEGLLGSTASRSGLKGFGEPSTKKYIYAALGLVVVGIMLGRWSKRVKDLRWDGRGVVGTGDEDEGGYCDPYTQTGILQVDLKTYRNNRFVALNVEPSCQPMNYMDLLHDGGEPVELEWLRGKTVVLYGDSVDREHLEHLCDFFQGNLEAILESHWLTPPLPKGREDRPGKEKGTGWEDNSSARPYLCTVERYDLKFLNFFHFGLADEDEWLLYDSGHFYPPGKVEDRFYEQVIPMLERLNPANPVPDLFSFTPGFWDMHRLAQYDPDRWSELTNEKIQWWKESMDEVLRGLLHYWDGDRPRIIWRALHHIKEWDMIPYNRLQIVDSLGRSVVEGLLSSASPPRLPPPPPHRPPPLHRPPPPPPHKVASDVDLEERSNTSLALSALEFGHQIGRATRRGPDYSNTPSRKVMRWSHTRDSVQRTEEGESGSSEKVALKDKLEVDNWGKLMLGQEGHFRDSLHPLPIPGSWLYGDMLLHQLKRAVDYQTRRQADH